MSDSPVLVTGASGFLGTHTVQTLQEAGFRVRGTVRSLKNESKVKHLYNLCPGAKFKVELVEADLTNAESWIEAVKDCEFVHHTASPFPSDNPRNEEELIRPAVDGTLNVLRACVAAKTVKRVILTSSVIAITDGGGNAEPLTEATWNDPHKPKTSAYAKSKILAEKAAWDFVKDLPENKKFELATVLPTLMLGPTLHGTKGSSMDLIIRLMGRFAPGLPKFIFPVVDVRDCALAHLRCQTVPEAAGNRHIITSKGMKLKDIAILLKNEFESQGYSVPTRELPNFMVTFASLFDGTLKSSKDFASQELKLDSSRMQNVLDISPSDPQEAIIDMAYSMIDCGFLHKTPKYRGRQEN